MINFALFGVGGIGAYHLAAIERHEKAGRARLLAVADPTADRLAGPKAALTERGVRWHLDYRELLERETEINAVVIATPIPFHFEMAQACLARDLFVNLEKPPTPLLAQLETLLAQPGSERVSVGFQMIGSRTVQALQDLLRAGKIGPLREINAGGCWPRLDSYYNRARWAGKMTMDGRPVLDGPATNALAHLVHDIMYLAAADRNDFAVPVSVTGELYRARAIESYDVASLRGSFASGVQFNLAVTHATEAALPFELELRGEEGWARLSEDGARLTSSCGIELCEPETTQQLLDRDHDHLLDVIEGRSARFGTRLADTRGYVSATNALFIASGAIHPIDPAHIRRYRVDDAEGFDVASLHEAVRETINSGRLFFEQDLPWATAQPATVEVNADQLPAQMNRLLAAFQ